jgi:hypothetical protein
MLNFVKTPLVAVALIVCSYIPMVSGQSSLDRQYASALEDAIPQFAFAEDHRTVSTVAMELAFARSRAGDDAGACAALRQSLEHYRKEVAQESTVYEPAFSSVYDDSDGMAFVRGKVGCGKA